MTQPFFSLFAFYRFMEVAVIALLLVLSIFFSAIRLQKYGLSLPEGIKKAQRFFAWVCSLMLLVCTLDYATNIESVPLTIFTWLLVCFLQSGILYAAFIALIDPAKITSTKVSVSFVIVMSYFTLGYLSYFEWGREESGVFRWLLIFGVSSYVLISVWFIHRFNSVYRHTVRSLDNFFSDSDSHRLSWIRQMFYISVGVGFCIQLLSMTQYPGLSVGALLLFAFYTILFVRFLNFAFKYHYLAQVISQGIAEEYPADLLTESAQKAPVEKVREVQVKEQKSYFKEIEKPLKIWVEQQNYLHPSVNLQDLASEIGTNRTYMSNYLNSECGMNFSEWVASMRIGHAKKLMLEQPTLPIGDIAEKVGYSDISVFSRQFSKMEKLSPLQWKKSIKNPQ